MMIFREIWSEHSLIDKEQKGVGEFFYLNTILVAASNATHYANFSTIYKKITNKMLTPFCYLSISECSDQISRKIIKSTYPINSLERQLVV